MSEIANVQIGYAMLIHASPEFLQTDFDLDSRMLELVAGMKLTLFLSCFGATLH